MKRAEQILAAGTKSIAFIMDDPDTTKGNFDHCVLFNIDANGSRKSFEITNRGTGTNI